LIIIEERFVSIVLFLGILLLAARGGVAKLTSGRGLVLMQNILALLLFFYNLLMCISCFSAVLRRTG